VDAVGQIRPDAPPVQLYNLRTDLCQRFNRAAAEPARCAAMRARFDALAPRPKTKKAASAP
jgi:hypothetical protein